MDRLRFYVNDRLVELRDVSPTRTLLQFLRYDMGLTGTKEGCAEGDCGACTVALLDPDAPGGPTFRAVNACLLLLPMVQQKRLYTVEGLRPPGQPHHPVQEHLVRELGSQCGYCTPGVIMSMFEACYRRDLDEPWKLDDQMCGNLCRCTGYRPIRDATRAVAGLNPDDAFQAALRDADPQPMTLTYAHDGQRYFNPSSFDDLFDALDAHPDADLVCGGTDLSLRVTKNFEHLPVIVSVEGLPDLARIKTGDDAWEIGAAVPLTDLEAAARDGALHAVERMLRFFGARQIKHRGTVGGNLCNASPIGDLPPVCLALEADLILRSRAGQRVVSIDDFFISYRKTALREGEILEAIRLPVPAPGTLSAAYKVSKRRELDISAVAACFAVRLDDDGRVVHARLAFGGMAATPARARAVEDALLGQPWTEERVEAAAAHLDDDFTPIDDHRGSAWYRRTLAANLLRGFFLETRRDPSPRLPQRPTATVLPEETR